MTQTSTTYTVRIGPTRPSFLERHPLLLAVVLIRLQARKIRTLSVA